MKSRRIKTELIGNVFVIIVLVIGILSSMQQYLTYRDYVFYNNARLLTADQLNEIKSCFTEEGFQGFLYQSTGYPVVITDVNGIILYSEKEEFTETVNVNEFIQIDQSLFLNDRTSIKTVFALVVSDKTVGFAAFYIPRKDVLGMEESYILLRIFMPIIIAGLLVICYLFYKQRKMDNRMIRPVNEMLESSKAIIEGDYNVAVIKTENKKLMNHEIDKLAYYFELMRDELKEKRRREEELKRSQKELITCISHDLKTPISTIKAYGEGLRDGMAKDEEKVQRYAEVIIAKSEVLTKMISDLLEHFNAELNQLSMMKKEQYFNNYVDKLAMELQELVHYHHMEFIYENTAPNLLLFFDESRITQVIANLVENSIKYGKEAGKIGVQVEYIKEVNQIYLKVWDDGYGIGATDIPFVFEKFYRSEKSRNMSIPGSGLGLSICKYIVEEHGGEIRCESWYNEGTNFIINLPV